MKNTDKCTKIIASFVVTDDVEVMHYQNTPLFLKRFDVLNDGRTRFEYTHATQGTTWSDTCETLLFEKLFSISISKLL